MLNWFLTNKEFILAVATFIASITAIIISVYQIHLSNKHQLFERRVNSYLFVSEIVTHYEIYSGPLERTRDSNKLLDVIGDYMCLTMVSPLKECNKLLAEFSDEDYDTLLAKIKDINSKKLETTLIFSQTIATPISDFIDCYTAVVNKLPIYYRFVDRNISDDGKIQITDIPFEQNERNCVIQAFDKLKKSFELVKRNDVLKQMRNETMLFKKVKCKRGN